MRIRGGLAAAVIACLCAVLLFAPTAEARKIHYKGQSSQGKKVGLATNARGRAQFFAIHFDARCRHSKISGGIQKFVPRFRKADFRSFTDGGTLRHHYEESDTVGKVRTHVHGKRVGHDRFRGTFTYKVSFFDHGEQFNSCRTRTIRWSVHR